MWVECLRLEFQVAHQILWSALATDQKWPFNHFHTSCQNSKFSWQEIGMILVNKVLQKLKVSKNVNNKKRTSKLIFFNEKRWKDLDNFWCRKLTLNIRNWHFSTSWFRTYVDLPKYMVKSNIFPILRRPWPSIQVRIAWRWKSSCTRRSWNWQTWSCRIRKLWTRKLCWPCSLPIPCHSFQGN